MPMVAPKAHEVLRATRQAEALSTFASLSVNSAKGWQSDTKSWDCFD